MYKILLKFILFFIIISTSYSQQQDSIQKKVRNILEESKVKSTSKDIEIVIRNVDITQFPALKIIVEAFNVYGEPLDTLYPDKLTVLENGQEKKVVSVEKISVRERVPVDFIFVIDKTGSMQNYINSVIYNIQNFTRKLVSRGIDFRLGLILFSDFVEKEYEPTEDVSKFMALLSEVVAMGGRDEKENALEALLSVSKMKFRPSANKVAVIVTDAPYHQLGEQGDGTTDYTTETLSQFLAKNDIRVFAIVPPRLTEYKYITDHTRGTLYDLNFPFSTILDNFSNQLSNLYALKYFSSEAAIPDSINVALLNERKIEIVRKTIPIVELGRKLIIENLLYIKGKANIPDSVKELELIREFMKNKPNIVILIEGHTDNDGSSKLNDELSELRAASVKKYLVQKGIAEYRIKTKGYGKRRPLLPNDTEEHKKYNRRTEIIIVSK